MWLEAEDQWWGQERVLTTGYPALWPRSPFPAWASLIPFCPAWWPLGTWKVVFVRQDLHFPGV